MPLYTGGRLTGRDCSAAELLRAVGRSATSARSRGDLVYNVSSLYFNQLAQTRLIDALAESARCLADPSWQRVRALVDGSARRRPWTRCAPKCAWPTSRQRLLREQQQPGDSAPLAAQSAGRARLPAAHHAVRRARRAARWRPREPSRIDRARSGAAPRRGGRPHRVAGPAAPGIEAARAGNRPQRQPARRRRRPRRVCRHSQQPPGTSAQDTTYRIGVLVDIAGLRRSAARRSAWPRKPPSWPPSANGSTS
ncbi:MAG: hypothetical protein MZU91_12595 [Desulfosudis oleivorans]|nr:hypothetical protein [Desulfosudis oleivorans]